MEDWLKALAAHDPIIGGLCVVLIGALTWAINRVVSQNDKLEGLLRECIQVSVESTASNNRLAASMNERSASTQALSESVRISAEATKGFAQVMEVQIARVIDRIDK